MIEARLRAGLEASTPDVWPRVLRSVTARRIATELLAELDRPPVPHGRLAWELRRRTQPSFVEARA